MTNPQLKSPGALLDRPTPQANTPIIQRLQSIDLMRGLVMALMALDHTRDFFSNADFFPTDLSKTTAALFLTRWVTHFCAPTFVFLTGVSAYLSTVRHAMPTRQLAGYLAKRGIWLVVLELTLVRLGWTFNWDYHNTYAGVIWVLGWSMLVLAGLVFLPRWLIACFAIGQIAGHNLFDTVTPEALGAGGWLWKFLHAPGRIEYLPDYHLLVMYPLVPWVGVMAAGYVLAPVFLRPTSYRRHLLLCLGFALIAVFLWLRLNNIYGDKDWLMQKDAVFSVLAVLNCSKYPPSLLYLLMTLGPMLVGLVCLETYKLPRFGQVLLIFGRVPLLFYLVHLPLIHVTVLLFTAARGLPIDWLYGSSRFIPKMPTPEYGYHLPMVYVIWLLMLWVLYPVCNRYAKFKQRHPGQRWLAYL